MEDPRKAYWNDKYVKYWQARVEEAGVGESDVLNGDVRTEDDDVYEKIFSDTPFNDGAILDVGCAWGRMFPVYKHYGLSISGVDISKSMIDLAEEQWSDSPVVDALLESSAEELPFDDGEFDNLVCLATFDATYQHKAMTEFLRVTKPGAMIYVTGKNNNYFSDDEPAMAAEIGARSKQHPNYFTDVTNLVSQLTRQGHKVVKAYYFSKRGDFAAMDYRSVLPDKFYEYFIIIERGETYSSLDVISDLYSKTYQSEVIK